MKEISDVKTWCSFNEEKDDDTESSRNTKQIMDFCKIFKNPRTNVITDEIEECVDVKVQILFDSNYHPCSLLFLKYDENDNLIYSQQSPIPTNTTKIVGRTNEEKCLSYFDMDNFNGNQIHIELDTLTGGPRLAELIIKSYNLISDLYNTNIDTEPLKETITKKYDEKVDKIIEDRMIDSTKKLIELKYNEMSEKVEKGHKLVDESIKEFLDKNLLDYNTIKEGIDKKIKINNEIEKQNIVRNVLSKSKNTDLYNKLERIINDDLKINMINNSNKIVQTNSECQFNHLKEMLNRKKIGFDQKIWNKGDIIKIKAKILTPKDREYREISYIGVLNDDIEILKYTDIKNKHIFDELVLRVQKYGDKNTIESLHFNMMLSYDLVIEANKNYKIYTYNNFVEHGKVFNINNDIPDNLNENEFIYTNLSIEKYDEKIDSIDDTTFRDLVFFNINGISKELIVATDKINFKLRDLLVNKKVRISYEIKRQDVETNSITYELCDAYTIIDDIYLDIKKLENLTFIVLYIVNRDQNKLYYYDINGILINHPFETFESLELMMDWYLNSIFEFRDDNIIISTYNLPYYAMTYNNKNVLELSEIRNIRFDF